MDDESTIGHKGKRSKSKRTHVVLSQSDYRHFNYSLTSYDNFAHSNVIKDCKYSEKLGGYITLENYQNMLKIFTNKGTEKSHIPLASKKPKVFILAFDFNE